MSNNIFYSEKYKDDDNEYRHVHIPKEMVKRVPKDHLMTESEWRKIGIQQSHGWVHYMHHKPDPNVVLFKRSLNYQQHQMMQ